MVVFLVGFVFRIGYYNFGKGWVWAFWDSPLLLFVIGGIMLGLVMPGKTVRRIAGKVSRQGRGRHVRISRQ